MEMKNKKKILIVSFVVFAVAVFSIFSFSNMEFFQGLMKKSPKISSLQKVLTPEEQLKKNRLSELDVIKKNVKDKNMKWVASSTKLFMLPDDARKSLFLGNKFLNSKDENFKKFDDYKIEIQKTYGSVNPSYIYEKDMPDFSELSSAESDVRTELPSSFSWTDIGGTNYITPIKDQGSDGSCWAFASLGAFEASYRIYNNIIDPSIVTDFSEADLCVCASYTNSSGNSRSVHVGSNYCEGNDVGPVLERLKNEGVMLEERMPYGSSDDNDIPPNDDLICQWPDPHREDNKIYDFYNVVDDVSMSLVNGRWIFEIDPTYTVPIKEALLYGPVITMMQTDYSFLSYAGGVYETDPSTPATNLHYVLLVGWDDEKQAWLVKNSSGVDWGENGFFWIKYNDASGIGMVDTYLILVAPPEVPEPIPDIKDKKTVFPLK